MPNDPYGLVYLNEKNSCLNHKNILLFSKEMVEFCRREFDGGVMRHALILFVLFFGQLSFALSTPEQRFVSACVYKMTEFRVEKNFKIIENHTLYSELYEGAVTLCEASAKEKMKDLTNPLVKMPMFFGCAEAVLLANHKMSDDDYVREVTKRCVVVK